MDNFFFNKKEIFQWGSYSFFEADSSLSTDDFLSLNLYPQISFQNRKQQNFLGLGKVLLQDSFLEVSKQLPPNFSYFIQRDFSAEKTSVWLPQVQLFNDKALLVEKTGQTLTFQKIQKTPTSFQLRNRIEVPKKQEWNLLFEKIYKNFQDSIFKKIVPARRVTFDIEGTLDHSTFYKKICNSANYNFYYATSPTEVFMGSSPERLISYENGTLYTEAIAGTRTKDHAQELLTSRKDFYEHQLVVEDIFQKIKPFASEIKCDVKPKLIESKNLAHLKTLIEVKLRSGFEDIFAILESLHPTSAICGMPKLAAQKFLKENECFQREKYAGFLGVINKDSAEICVTLRSCKIKDSQVSLYSGVGVVPESDAEQEWQELDYKIQPYLDLFT